MAFPPGFLDELRSRISLSGLIGRSVKLVRRSREYAGLCPFHHEKTPSFYVVEDKAFFHCFGCGAHGDAIGFVMRHDNLDFIEAIEKLAGEAGLAVPRPTPQERERAQQQKTLLGALEAAAAFYEARLGSPAGARARSYLDERGLDTETIRRFRLGWAPDDRQALRRSLSGDFPESLLIEAGLLRRPSSVAAGEPIDYFRSRIMFPIGDKTGRVIAFGGRMIGDGQPKYLNSPESAVFEKGHVLYGWAAARAGLSREAPSAGPGLIVAEGYMDVIALHRAGYRTAVAPLGTALTDFQLHDLWRLGPEPILCFDGDEPGQQAAARVLRRALPLLRPGCSLRFATLPSGEDPDSIIRTSGRAGLDQILAAARPLADMLWESEVRGTPRDTPERLAGIQNRLLEHVRAISDPMVRSEFTILFRQRCDPWQARRKSLRKSPSSTAVHDGPPPPPRQPQHLQREILFRILLHFPGLIVEVAEEFASLDLPEADFVQLRHEILALQALRPGLDAGTLQQHLVQSGFAATVDALLSPSVDTGFVVRCPDPASARKEWTHVIRMLGGRERSVMAEAGNVLESEVSAEKWERFQAAREQALKQGLIASEDHI
ncbi:MAG: DNA primase [Alphaproteobacteria bacterium]|nr:DNA primase [Alphaproteobacteria bacterium]